VATCAGDAAHKQDHRSDKRCSNSVADLGFAGIDNPGALRISRPLSLLGWMHEKPFAAACLVTGHLEAVLDRENTASNVGAKQLKIDEPLQRIVNPG
jgi:hypothetical protein